VSHNEDLVGEWSIAQNYITRSLIKALNNNSIQTDPCETADSTPKDDEKSPE
jgi:hypothetical protein